MVQRVLEARLAVADPTLEEVAKSWAIWASEGIVETLADRDLILDGDEEAVQEVLIEHLTDIAISNATRVRSTATEGK